MFKSILTTFTLAIIFVSSVNAQTAEYDVFSSGKKIGTGSMIKNGDNHEMTLEVGGVKETASVARVGRNLMMSKNGSFFMGLGIDNEPIYHKRALSTRHLVGKTANGEDVNIDNLYLGNGRYIDVTKINGKVYDRSESMIDQNDMPVWIRSRNGDNAQELLIQRRK